MCVCLCAPECFLKLLEDKDDIEIWASINATCWRVDKEMVRAYSYVQSSAACQCLCVLDSHSFIGIQLTDGVCVPTLWQRHRCLRLIMGKKQHDR